jgi:YHS domain-containing protein
LIRLLIFLGLLYLLYRSLKTLLTGSGRKPPVSGQTPDQIDDIMVQDPACGTYLPRNEAIKAKIGGRQHFFCSAECKQRYLKTYQKK